MTAGTVLLAIGLVLTVAGALGVAYAVFRTSSVGRTIEIYQQENAILGQRATRLEEEVKEQRAEASKEREKRAALEAALEALRQTISGEAAVGRLGEVIGREEAARREEHRQMLNHVDRIEAGIKRLEELLQNPAPAA